MVIMTQTEGESFQTLPWGAPGGIAFQWKELEFRIIPAVEVSKLESLFTNGGDIL
jgi:hypothetical protein